MLTDNAGVAEALDRALVGFLTTVDPSGQPQTSTVWFLREGDDLIVYNLPETRRLFNISGNDRVAFTLRADRHGNGSVTLEGRAFVDPDLPRLDHHQTYLDKYREAIASIGYTPERLGDEYRAGLRVRVTRVRSFGLRHIGDD